MKPGGIVALILVLAAGYFLRGWFQNYIVSRSSGKGPACLQLLGNTTTEDEGRTYIIGSIKNSCDYSFSTVTVLFKLDRRNGVELPDAVAYAYSRDVKPGETRRFKSALPVSKNTTFRFDGMNAY